MNETNHSVFYNLFTNLLS